MTTTPQHIRNVGLYLVPIAVGNLVPVLTLPIFTRLLSTEDFGAWALANAYAVVVAGLATVGLPIAYDRNFFQYREGRQRADLLFSVVLFSSASLMMCGALTWLLQAPITQWLIGPPRYQAVVVWSFWSSAIAAVKAYCLTYLRNSEKAGTYSAYTIAERVSSALLAIVFVAGLRVGVMGLVLGQLMAGVIVLAIISWHLLRGAGPRLNRHLLADSLMIGYPLMPRVLLNVVANNFDKYLIGQIASLGGVGVYSIGQRVANIGFTYMTALQNVFGPQVYSRMFSDDPRTRRSIGAYLTPFAYASTSLLFVVALFSEEILRLLAPASYYGAIPIVTILSLYYSIQFFGKMPQIAYARKTHLLSILGAVATMLNVMLGAAGIWLWGTIGAAWGVLAAGMATTAITVVLGQRCFRIDWETRKLAAVFLLLFASAFAVIGLRGAGVPYAVLAAVKVAAAAVFLWLGARLRIVTAQNLALVRDVVLRRVPQPENALKEAQA